MVLCRNCRIEYGYNFTCIHCNYIFCAKAERGGGGHRLKSAFNLLRSYHRLQVGFGGVCICMRGDCMWTCFAWAERSTPDNFLEPSHRFNSATGEQKRITQTIYTDSEPPSRTPNSLMPSAKLRSANLPFLRLWSDTVGDRTPASRTPSWVGETRDKLRPNFRKAAPNDPKWPWYDQDKTYQHACYITPLGPHFHPFHSKMYQMKDWESRGYTYLVYGHGGYNLLGEGLLFVPFC